MKTFVSFLVVLNLIVASWWTWATVAAYKFEIGCGGHLKRAADANTIEMAHKELVTAVRYLESKNLTRGSTAAIIDTPATDIEFWYTNLVASQKELEKLTTRTSPLLSGELPPFSEKKPSQLEETNVLMKLRETLLDHGKDGDSVTHPPNISIYPYATFNALMIVASVAVFLLDFGAVAVWSKS